MNTFLIPLLLEDMCARDSFCYGLNAKWELWDGHCFTTPIHKPHPLNSPGDPEDLLSSEELNGGHSCGYPHWCVGAEEEGG